MALRDGLLKSHRAQLPDFVAARFYFLLARRFAELPVQNASI